MLPITSAVAELSPRTCAFWRLRGEVSSVLGYSFDAEGELSSVIVPPRVKRRVWCSHFNSPKYEARRVRGRRVESQTVGGYVVTSAPRHHDASTDHRGPSAMRWCPGSCGCARVSHRRPSTEDRSNRPWPRHRRAPSRSHEIGATQAHPRPESPSSRFRPCGLWVPRGRRGLAGLGPPRTCSRRSERTGRRHSRMFPRGEVKGHSRRFSWVVGNHRVS